MKPAPFDYVPAASVAQAVDALARAGDDGKVLAGGQSLVPMLNFRLARPGILVDINPATELDGLALSGSTLAVGALVRQTTLARWAATPSPLLAEALRWVGHAAIRNRGTVVGSIVHADPAAELPAVLLGCDGSVVATRVGGERVIAARDFYLAPLTTTLAADELVTQVRFTLPPAHSGWGFAEVARRHGDFALVGAVALLAVDGDGRAEQVSLTFFGVGGTPIRAAAAEALLTGQSPSPGRIREAARAAAATLAPDADLHATAAYRRQVASVLAERTLSDAVARCGRGT